MFMSDGFEYKSKMNNLPPQLEPIKKFVEEIYKKYDKLFILKNQKS